MNEWQWMGLDLKEQRQYVKCWKWTLHWQHWIFSVRQRNRNREKEKEKWMAGNEIGVEGEKMVRDAWGERSDSLSLWPKSKYSALQNDYHIFANEFSPLILFCEILLTLPSSLRNNSHSRVFFANEFSVATFHCKTIIIHCEMILIAFTWITPMVSVPWRHTVSAKVQKS